MDLQTDTRSYIVINDIGKSTLGRIYAAAKAASRDYARVTAPRSPDLTDPSIDDVRLRTALGIYGRDHLPGGLSGPSPLLTLGFEGVESFAPTELHEIADAVLANPTRFGHDTEFVWTIMVVSDEPAEQQSIAELVDTLTATANRHDHRISLIDMR